MPCISILIYKNCEWKVKILNYETRKGQGLGLDWLGGGACEHCIYKPSWYNFELANYTTLYIKYFN